jgi:hypothetical protein
MSADEEGAFSDAQREGLKGRKADRPGPLRRELGDGDQVADFADMRQRIAWLLTAFRHQRARESDLIYEAYYRRFNVELRPDP